MSLPTHVAEALAAQMDVEVLHALDRAAGRGMERAHRRWDLDARGPGELPTRDYYGLEEFRVEALGHAQELLDAATEEVMKRWRS